MNVLAAPFLYTMPSELEAFFCFAKFIEESCPLYVQPTLEGVHRGLKVRFRLTGLSHIISCAELKILLLTTPRVNTAPRPLPQDRRPRDVQLSTFKEPLRRTLCLSLCVSPPPRVPCANLSASASSSRAHIMRMHAAARRSPPALGFPPRIRRPPQRALRHRAAAPHARVRHGVIQVRLFSSPYFFAYHIK